LSKDLTRLDSLLQETSSWESERSEEDKNAFIDKYSTEAPEDTSTLIAEILSELISSEDLKGLITNVFCPTGEGGGVDPSCKKDVMEDYFRKLVREKFISATESEIQEMSSRSVDSVRLYGLPLKEQYSVVSEYVQYVFPYYRSLEEEVDPRGAELQEILLTHTLPQDETLYRRVSGSYADSLLNSKIGSEVSTGNFFASTSRDPLVAKHFGKGRGVTMVIKAPRGTKGGFVTDRGSEILLPANTVMRIDSLENDQIMLSVISQ
jgi:hypothetical protein